MDPILHPPYARFLRLLAFAFTLTALGFGLETTARAALGPVVVEQVKDIRPGPGDGDPFRVETVNFSPAGQT